MRNDPRGRDRLVRSTTLFTVVALLIAAFLLSISIGAWEMTLADVLEILRARMTGEAVRDPAADAIVWQGRVPRAMTGVGVGFALGAAGTIMQGIFRNPMASPGIIGTSSGAAFGAVTAIYFGMADGAIYAVPLSAILFALGSLFLVLMVATTGGLTSRYTLLLGGIACNAIFTALASVVIVLSTEQAEMTRRVVSWLMGDLNNRSWDHAQIILGIALLGILGALLYARDLNILMICEEQALNLGVNVVRSRTMLLCFAALLTGGAVAVAGGIGFVGLIAPHVMRNLLGSDNRLLIPAAGILGGGIVTFSDCIVRVWGGGGLRIGILTALLGGPFFLYLIIRDRRKYVHF